MAQASGVFCDMFAPAIVRDDRLVYARLKRKGTCIMGGARKMLGSTITSLAFMAMTRTECCHCCCPCCFCLQGRGIVKAVQMGCASSMRHVNGLIKIKCLHVQINGSVSCHLAHQESSRFNKEMFALSQAESKESYQQSRVHMKIHFNFPHAPKCMCSSWHAPCGCLCRLGFIFCHNCSSTICWTQNVKSCLQP